MKLKIIITEKAQQDIRAIRLYTRTNFGADQNKKYMRELRQEIEQLRIQPGLGINRSEEFGRNMHSRFVGGHTLYYTFDSENIAIITILHQRQLPEEHIPQESV